MPPLQSFFVHRAASLSAALAISVALLVLGAVPAFAATSEPVAPDEDEHS